MRSLKFDCVLRFFAVRIGICKNTSKSFLSVWDCGKLSDERYATLSTSYEAEQQMLKAAVPEMQAYLETETDKTVNLQQFIRKVKKITELKVLTPELIHEFVEKIVVYAPKYLDGKRIQIVDIHYSGVGILNELTPEEMEESFQKSIAERKKTETA